MSRGIAHYKSVVIKGNRSVLAVSNPPLLRKLGNLFLETAAGVQFSLPFSQQKKTNLYNIPNVLSN